MEADDIMRSLRDMTSTWEEGVETERANLVASVHDRVVATDKGIVEVEHTGTP